MQLYEIIFNNNHKFRNILYNIITYIFFIIGIIVYIFFIIGIIVCFIP